MKNNERPMNKKEKKCKCKCHIEYPDDNVWSGWCLDCRSNHEKSPKPEKKCKQITHISSQTKKDINKPTKGVRVEEIKPIEIPVWMEMDGADGEFIRYNKLANKINQIIKVLNSR